MSANKAIGILSNRDFFFKKTKSDNYIQNFYYSVPSFIIENLGHRNPCLIIPYELNFIDYYVDILSSIILVGSDTNICPSFYNEERKFDIKTCSEKSNFEITFLKKFIPTGKPILGICAGMQNLNVACGGSLYQDLHVELNINHEQKVKMTEVSHSIDVKQNTILGNIFQSEKEFVNSFHNQAVKALGFGLTATAFSEDGTIEAIELNGHKFCLGVQWHPEFNANQKDDLIFKAFQDSL